MADRPYPRSGRRDIINYAQFLSTSEEYAIVCVNRSVLDVARVLLASRGVWPTTYALSYGDSSYTPVGSVELHFIDQLISEFLGSTAIMNCDDFLAELTAIGAAITGISSTSGCGCGAGGAPTSDPPLSPVYVGPPGERVGDPPDGFSTWDEYETYKCDLAEHLWSLVRSDLTWMQAADLVGITATGLALALLSPIPFDEVVLLVGLILAIIAQGAMAAALADMIQAMNDSKSEIICALYEASDAAGAESALSDAIDAAIDLVSSDPWAGLMKAMLKTMFSTHGINKLFERDDSLADSDILPSGDCSGCVASCPQALVDDGTLIDWSPPFLTVQSIEQGSGPARREQVTIRVNWNGSVWCDTAGRPADIDSLVGFVPHSEPTVDEFEIDDQAGGPVYNGSTQWPDATCGARYFIRGDKDNTFTVTFEIGGNCVI